MQTAGPSASTPGAASTPGSASALQPVRWAEEMRGLLRLAIPVVLSELGWMAMSIVDTIMVGRLSPEAIGAVGISSAIYYAPALFGLGILLGLDTLVSQAYGRGDFDDCHHSLSQGVYLAFAYTPVSMLLVWLAPRFFPALQLTEAVRGPATEYLRLLNWGTLPLLLYAAFRRYLQGVGKVRPVTFALVSANLVNWLGNWALIYGKLGLPAMGVRGSALSTCVARLYMAGVLVWWAWKHERERGHPLFARWQGIRLRRLGQLLRIGLPSASQLLLEVGAFGTSTVLAGRLSPDALAAHQIVLSNASLTYMVPLGVSAAAAVAVGHAVGAGDHARARRSGWMAIGAGVLFMAFAALLFVCAPHAILGVYTRDPEVIATGTRLLLLAAVFQIFDAIQTVSTGAMRGLGRTRAPMLINLGGYWFFGLPLGYLLCFRARMGIYGLWLALTLALILVAGFLLREWSRDSRAASG
ncbi:MAG TPA: MATE family efflux transporter [Acidobacteriaceae bacterium]|nr:MATE family efflux transporter [Acidobacteriaceae bacterium]